MERLKQTGLLWTLATSINHVEGFSTIFDPPNFSINFYHKNSLYNCSNGHTKSSFTYNFFWNSRRIFLDSCTKTGHLKTVLSTWTSLKPSLPLCGETWFFRKPPPPLLSTWGRLVHVDKNVLRRPFFAREFKNFARILKKVEYVNELLASPFEQLYDEC